MILKRENVYGGQFTHGTCKSVGSSLHHVVTELHRFAAVTYGRPLGINNEDCTVAMPCDFLENPHYKSGIDTERSDPICYSPYQTALNNLYLIASPVIKQIYCARLERADSYSRNAPYVRLVQDVTDRLWEWRKALPLHLVMDLEHDCPTEMSATMKAHRLQSLALQLTFDNLLIILHRPFITLHVDLLKTHPSGTAAPSEDMSPRLQGSSSQEWWDAALRTSHITELPQLAQLATDSHLVAFLAIVLFNSAIVMVVLALSHPLSDKAQEVKRVVTRIFRLQEIFGRRSKLSMQSSAILGNLTKLLLRRENEAIFAPVPASANHSEEATTTTTPSSTAGLLSVKETLNLPLSFSQAPALHDVDQDNVRSAVNLGFTQSLGSLHKGESRTWSQKMQKLTLKIKCLRIIKDMKLTAHALDSYTMIAIHLLALLTSTMLGYGSVQTLHTA